MTIIVKGKDLKRDGAGNPIQGGSELVEILEVAITTADWTAIQMPSDKFCKQFNAGTRDGSSFYASPFADGTRYRTVTGGILGVEMAGEPGQVLFYAKGAANTTLEVMLVD